MASPDKEALAKEDSDHALVSRPTGSSLPRDATTPGSPGKRDSTDASERQPKFSRTASHPSRGQMDEGMDATRKRQSYRRGSSFDLPHVNSVPTAPADLKKLEAIDLSKVPWWTSQRFLLSIISFFGFALLYAQRVNLSIGIVSMVIHEPATPKDNSTLNLTMANGGSGGYSLATTTAAAETGEDDKCPELTKSSIGGEFHWSKPLQGLILGAFFWGYLVLQVAGGMMSERFGAKRVITAGMVPVAVLTILSPVCARADPYLFLVVRVVIGLGEGVVYPAAQALWANWAPPNERSRLIGFTYAGGQFGNALIFPIGGFLSAYGFDGGWPSIFYVIGTCGFIWCVVWILFAADYPSTNKWISDIEKRYIQASVGERNKKKKNVTTPWKAIFTSSAMWAIIVAHVCGNYGTYMLLTQIPSYMKEVLKFDIKSNGVYSMLPYLVFWFCITISSVMADLLITKEILTIKWARKIMATIGLVGPGCFLIGTGFMQCHQQIEAVVLLTLAVGFCGFGFSSYFINHGDIAPAFAGTLFGITNTAATVPGIVAPYVVSAMTPNGTQQQWQQAFFVAAAIYFLGAVVYFLLNQGEVQPWAVQEETEDKGQGKEFAVGLHDLQEENDEVEDEAEARAADKMLSTVNGKKSKTKAEHV